MNMKRTLIVAAAVLAACQNESTGYIRLSLPESAPLRAAAEAPSATFEDAGVSTWTVTVTGEDMAEPVVVTTGESEVTLKVPAGAARLVHVSGRGEPVNGIAQGYDGETTVDVPEEGDAEAVVDVFRSVSVIDANQPVARDGKTVSASAPDVESLTVTLGAEAMQVYVEFSNDVAAPWNASADNSLRGMIEVDTDRNPLTGDVSLVQARRLVMSVAAGEALEDLPLGVDFALDLTPADEGFVRLLVGDVAKPVSAHFGARRLSVTVPYAEVGGKITAMRFAALLSDRSGAADFVPEKDYVEIAAVSTPAPEAKLTAITKFTGNFVTTIDRQQGSALPVLRSSVGGFRAAWTTGKGFDYATSENGEVFTVKKSVALPSPQLAVTLDLATDEVGNVTVVTTEKAYVEICGEPEPCVLTSSVLQDIGGKVFDVVTTDPLQTSYYQGKAKVAMISGTAIVTEPLLSGSPLSAYVFKDGSRVTKSQVFDGTAYYVNSNLQVRAGQPVLTMLEQDFSAGIVSRVHESAGQAGAVSFPQPTKLFDISPDYHNDLSVGFSDASAFYLTNAPAPTGDLWAFKADGTKAEITGANFVGPVGIDPNYWLYDDIYSAPEIAVSPSGRVGVVWHANATLPPMAAPPLRLAPGDGGDEIYYAEILPGNTTFSTPVLVGRGVTASLAFDVQERPVVLVVNASLADLGFGYRAPQGSQFVYVYRGE